MHVAKEWKTRKSENETQGSKKDGRRNSAVNRKRELVRVFRFDEIPEPQFCVSNFTLHTQLT